LPNGEVHYRYYKRGYLAIVPVCIFISFIDWQWAMGNLVGYSFHRWCDNDLDLMGVNSAEGRQVNELPIIGIYLFGMSSMYGAIFRRFHRHWITHFPFVSTLIRMFFMFIFPFLIMDGYGINFIGNGWHKFWIGFWFGLSEADAIHWYLDKKSGWKD